MPTLRWPDGRGKFVDHDPADADDGEGRRVVLPGETVDVSDDVADHYQDRGFEAVDDDGQDGSGGDEATAESPDGDLAGYDTVEAFLDRTPVDDVVDDINAGAADGYLEAVADAADRVTVEETAANRADAITSG